MLLRGRRSLFGGGAGTIRSDQPEDNAEAESTRKLGHTSIYRKDPLRNWTAPNEDDVVKTPAERLVLLMRDGKFHTIAEIEKSGLQFVELLVAMEELLRVRRAFDRVGKRFSDSSLRMRALRSGEAPQVLWKLVRGIDVRRAERPAASVDLIGGFSLGCVEQPVTAVEGGEVSDDPRSENEDSGEARDSDGLILSDPPRDLTMPLAWVGSMVNAILAKRGSGKSYLGMVLVEELLRISDRPKVVVFDPTGAWWGLGAGADGGAPPHDVVIVGGPRGHVRLPVGSGAGLAKAVQLTSAALGSQTLIVDMSEMAPAEQHEMVADFCEALMVLPPFKVHVVIDEADEFVPQQCDGNSEHQSRARVFLTKLVMRGRKKGIGATLITLRPAILSKNVLSQVDALFLLRMVETNDLRAIEAWLENFEGSVSVEHRAKCLASLPLLPVGTAYYLRGGDEVTFRRFHVRRKLTFDSSRTPDGVAGPSVVLKSPRSDIVSELTKIIGGQTK